MFLNSLGDTTIGLNEIQVMNSTVVVRLQQNDDRLSQNNTQNRNNMYSNNSIRQKAMPFWRKSENTNTVDREADVSLGEI